MSAVDNTLLGLVLNRVGHKSAGGYGSGYYGYYDPETGKWDGRKGATSRRGLMARRRG